MAKMYTRQQEYITFNTSDIMQDCNGIKILLIANAAN